MNAAPMILLTSIERFDKPFPYFTSVEAFGKPLSTAALSWFEADAPWELVESDFYEQFEFDLLQVRIPPPLDCLSKPSFLQDLRLRVAGVFGVKLSERVDCTAHKLVEHQTIRIHNDFVPGQETHRLLIQLNRGWNDDQGGFLMLFNSPDPADVHRIFRPIHDSALGFAISEESNHAVSTIHGGERFTLVFSFYGGGDGSGI